MEIVFLSTLIAILFMSLQNKLLRYIEHIHPFSPF